MDDVPTRIVLIGPSGSGKSELAVRLAKRLGYDVVDTDTVITDRIGMPIVEFFIRFGEPAFRAIESNVVSESTRRQRIVIATGGGSVLAPENWVAWRPESVVLALVAAPATLVGRVRKQGECQGDLAERPLLAGDAIGNMRKMLEVRGHLYAQADAEIDTDWLSASEVTDEAIAALARVVREQRVPRLSVGTPVERSDIYVGSGVRDAVATLVRQRWPRARRVWVITDENVAGRWLIPTRDVLIRGGFEVRDVVVPAGEASKSMRQVTELCDALTLGGVGRRDVVLALGGGVVGDLAGFVAAICLRGLALVQLPTTLLAMVDSSVGGKTGVNNVAGKNMIGTFNQPGVVAIDPDFLTTLSREEYRSGMGEVIKHAVIQQATPLGGDALQTLLSDAKRLDPIDDARIDEVIALNVAIKHSVVQADEREAGLRKILNFGHTAGHAIEADGYRYRHGEAVALGMLVAGDIARQMGRVDADWDEALAGLIVLAGLPVRVEGHVDHLLQAMTRDKKAVDGALTWILPRRKGGVEVVSDIPSDVVAAALRSIGAT